MKSVSPASLAVPSDRPQKLYRYSQRIWLERSLAQGEFRLQPPEVEAASSDRILPWSARQASMTSARNYLTLSLASAWDEKLFDAFPGTDCCLIIHDPEQFGERIHRAAQRALPSWAGIDAAVSYGMPSPLGATFSKSRQFALEKEWLFAWRPMQPGLSSRPVIIRIGSIEGIAELRQRAV